MNEKTKQRLADIKDEMKDVAQKILNQEHMLYLLEQFNVCRIELLEASVNQYFDLIKWKFYSYLENGGVQPVCRMLVGGIDYEVSLNKSDKILCQMDLCKGFQRANEINIPIIADDMESVDPGRIPNYDNQMILFRRNDCSLTVRKM